VTMQTLTSDQTARAIRAFLASYDASDATDRGTAYRIRERLHSEIYRRERTRHAEWIDIGGEA
jgi:hypothetical protein